MDELSAARRFPLRHSRGQTEIATGRGALAALAPELGCWLDGRRLFLLSTPRVRALHGASLDPLRRAAGAVTELEVPDGEAAKSVAHAEMLWRAMAAAGGRRDSRLVAFGGGSVGDLGGFVAGTFLRGIEFAQAPTTLLAQVDAAIGGKTGVDLPEGKNLVGLFHHPAYVVAEASWLATLPVEELRGGLAEAIKMAALLDPGLFAVLEQELERLLAGDSGALGTVAAGAARAKVRVVESDVEERGERKLLNFGHTLGHALETAAGHGVMRHGDAVAWGMRFALRLALARGWAADLAPRLERLLDGLAPGRPPVLDATAVRAALGRDKKARESGLGWVLPRALGEGRWDVPVDAAVLEDLLPGFLREAAGRSGPVDL